ncbi:hypothetical protein E3Q17_00520 [Wallemia mellicola]|uniref:Uncharacterized protein n=1 Tax=Wallemia mellicola TaxID=1708541 RepID=A0A4T0QGK6_9BASI|nr:hypothetical protein E3Q17_00520 [Wallemia mellicola]TIC08537.1 hypothetical protein E3Q14_03892 [Wallemia mellicola]TIC23289.1 hypothetical protein E3Q11_03936 [Wallemia mellicola]TIC62963.1 hypothetical protein E3Q01_03641 [Wallemia mellicola]
MAPYPFRSQVAQEEMEHSRHKSTSDTYIPQQSRTEYAQRLFRRLPKHIDIDSYYMTVYPGELLALFNGSATVGLVSHKPSIRDVEEYEDWVYVGRSVAMLLIAPRYKDRLYRKLRSLNYTIELAPYERAFIKEIKSL